jgi:hypothetical protein
LLSKEARSIAANVAKLPELVRKAGVGRKRDHRRKTGAAFRAKPNVTGVLVAPILGPYGRNQLSVAVNAMHHVNPFALSLLVPYAFNVPV